MDSNHWVGSNSILHVVDENVKVMGTDNLFVIDVSVLVFEERVPTQANTGWKCRHQL